MSSLNVRNLAAALLLGSAFVAGGVAFAPSAVEAAGVRPAVGKPLQQAQSLAAAGKYQAALDAVAQAEAVPNKTASETQIIGQMRTYIESKSGDPAVYEKMIASGQGSASVARQLIGAHYRAHQYAKVIADADTLRRFGAMDGTSQTIIAQAYFEMGDYKGTIKFLKATGKTDLDTIKLLYGAAYKSGDTDTIQSTLEQLVLATGDPEYWRGAIDLAEHTHGLTDPETLDLLRLRLATGTMRPGASGDDDYSLLSQIAIQLKLPGEAQAVMQKGMDAKMVSGERAQRLFNMAKTQAGADTAALTAEAAQANASPKGDLLVQLGAQYTGYGRYQDAVTAITAGIAKGVTHKDDAEMRLGQAYIGLGQRDAAVKAFNSVSKDDQAAYTVAHLWSIYARAGSRAATAEAAPTKHHKH
jgi:tetratricopeptide (TPR) repeat protein